MLTSHNFCVNIVFAGHKSDCAKKLRAGVAQLAEQLICNQQVAGSSPITSSKFFKVNTGGFPSGQRGQTVNLLRLASMVRIHLPPPAKRHFSLWKNVFFIYINSWRNLLYILRIPYIFDSICCLAATSKGIYIIS